MRRRSIGRVIISLLAFVLLTLPAADSSAADSSAADSSADERPADKRYRAAIQLDPPHFSQDSALKLDYDLIYVRAPRFGDRTQNSWPDVARPLHVDPGADLMLLHPDGTEAVLVEGGADGAVVDPFVSFDGQWVYYAHFRDIVNRYARQADLHKIHVATRKIVRLTSQELSPNTGMSDWSRDGVTAEPGKNHLTGVFHLGPCPLPGGRLIFTSNRNGFLSPKATHSSPCLQLSVMDDPQVDPTQGEKLETVAPRNLEQIGYLNLAMALHPVVLKDGRVMFSSMENQGLRSGPEWGLWSIHPDGSNWGPLMSAVLPGGGSTDSLHFQTQLSDGHIVVERYYLQNNFGFGLYYKLPVQIPADTPQFGPANPGDPRNPPLRNGRYGEGEPALARLPFTPYGLTSLTPFVTASDMPSNVSVLGQADSPRVGKFTHPSGAPDNHLLTVWAAGPVNHNSGPLGFPYPDSGLYLIKDGRPIDEPAQMRLIKNDPHYNEQWPRALVPYQRIYGVAEPPKLAAVPNDGRQSPHLPEGTPFGLVGTSSLYKRETYPLGGLVDGAVTSDFVGEDRLGDRGLGFVDNSPSLNWINQGAEAGRYTNSDIHAIRILALEASSDRSRGPQPGRLFFNHVNERMRILGEIPVRKFGSDGTQPLDPDGHPDTSFLAKIPADMAWTFQTLDKDGMVLNMAQTWHQLRPGEVRTNCGGCHAHSQQPTLFEQTVAARADYTVFDLTRRTPLLTSRNQDASGKQWDIAGQTGLRFEDGVKDVEYRRDIQPILERSCVACHTGTGSQAAGDLVLDDHSAVEGLPGDYYRLARDKQARFGPKSVTHGRNGAYSGASSRYVVPLQSRRSLLVWKIFGRRCDGFTNDDFPTPATPGDPRTLQIAGRPVDDTPANCAAADIDYIGSVMPPPAAVAGTYISPTGQTIQVEPLTDEDRRTLVRWIDLGCPIDLDPARPGERSYGWMGDESRPTLTLTSPPAGTSAELSRLVIGMHDYYSGLERESFTVTADFSVNGARPGTNLAPQFQDNGHGVWELPLEKPILDLPNGHLSVTIKDRQGNISRVERKFTVGKAAGKEPVKNTGIR